MTFQALDNKGYNFLELLDDEDKLLEPTYSKGRMWLKYFSHSNLLYTRVSKAIINHTPIKKYWLRFFLHEEFKCLCSDYSIKLRHHILHECKRFNNLLWYMWELTFFFFFYLFFLILYFFSFDFLFLFIDDEEVCDIAVTWQVTWCNIIGLEHSRRIWKITLGHMVYT